MTAVRPSQCAGFGILMVVVAAVTTCCQQRAFCQELAAQSLVPQAFPIPARTTAARPLPGSQRPAQPLSVRLPPICDSAIERSWNVQAAATLRQQAEMPLPGPTEMPLPPEGIWPGQPDAVGGMTLDEVTQIALANSPVIREARSQWVAASGQAVQASFYPNPTWNTFAPQLNGDQSQYGTSLTQQVVTKGKIRLDTAAAERAAMIAEMTYVRARFDLLTMVRERFYMALAAERRVTVLESMVEIARKSHGISERLLKAGVGPRSDVLLLQIELSKAEAQLVNARTLAETSRRQLSAATGLVDLQIARVEGDLAHGLPEYDMLATQHEVLARNALVRRAEFDVARARVLLRRAEVDPFPNINMTGGYQRQGPGNTQTTDGSLLNQGLYEVQLVIPLYNQNQGNIRSAQATIGAALATYNRVRTELANDTAAALGRYLTARQLADRYEREIVPSATDVQRITAQLYNQGQIEFVRYLASQRALLDASLEYILAQEQRWSAAAEIAGLLQSEQFP